MSEYYNKWVAKPGNREKRNAYMRAWGKRTPELRFARYQRARLKRYGLTPETFEKLLKDQEYKCAICQEPLEIPTKEKRTRNGRSLVIDHCHETNIVRGILHNDCNRAIGFFKDKAIICLQAADYLTKKVNQMSNNRVKEAMKHPDVLGAGAAKRKKLSAKEDFQAVMAEWKRGTLRSGSGEHVKSQKQAEAIAFSESKKR